MIVKKISEEACVVMTAGLQTGFKHILFKEGIVKL